MKSIYFLKIKTKVDNYDTRFILSLIFCVILSLYPLLQSGYFGDDIINSYTQGYLLIEDKTLWSVTYAFFSSWVTDVGRFFPFAWYVYALYIVIGSNLIVYKLVILLFLIINIFLFGKFTRIITDDRDIARICMLIMPILFQFRNYHDPILSYHILLQLVFLYILTSLIYLQKYLVDNKVKNLIISIIFYNILIYTYEIGYVFFILHFAISIFKEKDIYKSFKRTAPYFISTMIAATISISLRLCNSTNKGAYSLNIDLIAYIKTFARQIYAAVPFSYYMSHKELFKDNWGYNFLDTVRITDLCACILFIYIAYRIYTNRNTEKKNETRTIIYLISIGILLAILPGAIISLSPKYQQEITIGVGYLSVYIQYFGVSMIIIAIMLKVSMYVKSGILKKVFITITIAILALLNLFNIQHNRVVVQEANKVLKYPRITLENALQSGILNQLPDDSVVIISKEEYPTMLWDNEYFFKMHSNKNVKIMDEDYLLQIENKDEFGFYFQDVANSNIYILNYNSVSDNNGYVLLGKVTDYWYTVGGYDMKQVNVTDVHVYVEDKLNLFSTVLYKKNQDNYHSIETCQLEEDKEITIIPLVLEEAIDFKSIRLTTGNSRTYTDFNIVQNDELSLRPSDLVGNEFEYVLHCSFSSNELVYDTIKGKYIGFGNTKSSNQASSYAPYFEEDTFIELGRVDVGCEFTIEIVLYPEKQTQPYAAIIGNHPGENNYEGFVIHRNGQDNEYSVGMGDGEKWMDFKGEPCIFTLEPNKWHYLVMTYDGNSVNIYDNGTLVKRAICNDKLMQQSDMPIYVGNWMNKDRGFKGMIQEVSIHKGVKTFNHIKESFNKLKLVKDNFFS